MTALTLTCVFCNGSGREYLGEIFVKCHACKGVGSVPAPNAASESPAPVLTLEEAFRRIRQLEQAIVMLHSPDPPPSLATRRLILRKIEEELQKSGGAR